VLALQAGPLGAEKTIVNVVTSPVGGPRAGSGFAAGASFGAGGELAHESRAVLRPVEAGSNASCAFCGERLRFSSRSKARKVIANVYVAGRWDRVEQFHDACYQKAGAPYGAPS
jgi:hypothetical protein